tara:strand:- start:2925 stop:3545 length:621 start_codon:yes stop_codon:yes gene_type:complete
MLKVVRQEDFTYRVDGKKRSYPGVTTILKSIIQPYGFVQESDLIRARARGTAVHRAIEIIEGFHGNLTADFDPRIEPFLDEYREIKRLTRFVPIGFEVAVADPLGGYGGLVDAYGHVYDGQEAIVDFKTGIPPWWCNLQTAAYAPALEKTIGGKWSKAKRFCFSLTGKGRSKPIEYTDRNDIHKFNNFLSVYHQMADAGALRERAA